MRLTENKHPLDIATFVVVCLGFVAAAAAAWFTHSQVGISRDTEERQLRAYVGVEEVNLDLRGGNAIDPTSERGGEAKFTKSYFMPTLKNYGLTPARNVQLRWQSVFSSGDLPFNFDFNEYANQTVHPSMASRGTLNAGQVGNVKAPLTLRTNALFQQAISKGMQLYVYGSYTYTDVYDKRWRDTFCFLVDKSDTDGHAFIPCDRHNDETQIDS